MEILELKNIRPVTELSLDGINSRLGTREERINDLEDRLIEIIQTKVHRGKKIEKIGPVPQSPVTQYQVA